MHSVTFMLWLSTTLGLLGSTRVLSTVTRLFGTSRIMNWTLRSMVVLARLLMGAILRPTSRMSSVVQMFALPSRLVMLFGPRLLLLELMDWSNLCLNLVQFPGLLLRCFFCFMWLSQLIPAACLALLLAWEIIWRQKASDIRLFLRAVGGWVQEEDIDFVICRVADWLPDWIMQVLALLRMLFDWMVLDCLLFIVFALVDIGRCLIPQLFLWLACVVSWVQGSAHLIQNLFKE